MTSLGMYDCSDSVMEPLAWQTAPKSHLRRLHLCGDMLSSEGRDGRTVFQPVVSDGLSLLLVSLGDHIKIDMCLMIDCENSSYLMPN